MPKQSKADSDNHANQKNPNNEAYQKSRSGSSDKNNENLKEDIITENDAESFVEDWIPKDAQ